MLQPIKDRILCEIIHMREKTEGGLYIPNFQEKLLDEAHVHAVGPDVTSVQPGDRIIFDQYAGVKVHHEGKELLIIKLEDAVAVVEKDE